MDPTVPKAAGKILDLIASKESGSKGYEVISSNKQHLLPKPLTKMNVKEVLLEAPKWRSKYGTLSSAAGRYQIITKTLMGLAKRLDLKAEQKFDPNLQDRLGLDLLRQRGYDRWIKRQMTTDGFMLQLAKEWASFPVPFDVKGADGRIKKRGQSFYAGDGMNKALIDVSTVWTFLENLRNESGAEDVPVTPPPPVNTEPVKDEVDSFWQILVKAYQEYMRKRSNP